jgi:adenosylcobinamide-phosphate synthase
VDLNSPLLLVGIVVFDLMVGDPRTPLHPVVLMGRSLTWFEEKLLQTRHWNRLGGCYLFIFLLSSWTGLSILLLHLLHWLHPILGWCSAIAFGGMMLAYRSLVEHLRQVDLHDDTQLQPMRRAVAMMVGRDTAHMDTMACRRAGIESLAENFVDGVLSPLFWFVVAGLPGLITFKVISTMDSMVGYLNERYRDFGWAGARLDDLCNWIPARISWLLFSLAAAMHPRLSASVALKVGWAQHQRLAGFNSGWPESTLAGALRRRLVGPIWRSGVMTSDFWLGRPQDPECGTKEDLRLAQELVAITTAMAVLGAVLLLSL